MDLLNRKIGRTFKISLDLASHLEETHLSLKLTGLPSNKIGEQFWCIIGARESYFEAIKNEKWMGFASSLKDATSKLQVQEALSESQKLIAEFIAATTLNKTQENYLFALFEHEVQHHGQLIRYVYGNKLSFPKSWNKHYSV